MNEATLISIITVCYNSKDTIERTIVSVLQQKFKDYEYIIVDGASTDGTVDIIKHYEPLFEGRMCWKSEPDNGIYDAFNKGVTLSSGKYVWIVNSDDYIEPDAFKIIADNIPANPESILCFATKYIKKDGSEELLSASADGGRKGFVRDWAIAPHTSIVVPKVVYDKHGVYDDQFRLSGDVDWMHRMYKAGVSFEVSPLVITNFTEGGLSTSGDEVWKEDRMYYFKKNYSNPIIRFIHKFIWKKVR